MLARLRKSKDDERGFTLIELLVVMIIIGILAAIAIPVFLSQRQKARDTAAKADASTIGKEIATYFVDNTAAPTSITISSGRYSLTTASGSIDLGRASSNIQLVDYTGKPVANGTALALNGTNAMTPTGWCVAVADNSGGGTTTPTGSIAKYSATNGLVTGAACSAANGS